MELDNSQREKVEKFIDDISRYFGVDREMMYGDGGGYTTHSNARHFCWYILHCNMNISIRLIANMFLRSERSIKRGISKIRFGIEYQAYYREKYDDVVGNIEIPDISL